MTAELNPYQLVVPALDEYPLGLQQDFRIARRGLTLRGYQLYAVEQWVVDRSKPNRTFVTHTNIPSHTITVNVATPRADSPEGQSATWDKLLSIAKADGFRLKQTHIGYIYIVELSSFRSDLNTVLMPDGDFDGSKDALYANINLRRLGCGARSALTLAEPGSTQQDKFLQTYRLPDIAYNPAHFVSVVLMLVKLVQSALFVFGLGPLAADPRGETDPDGLLCDDTMKSLIKWQTDIGEAIMGGDLGSGVMRPAATASLLSVIILLKNRLQTLGLHHVPTDPFMQRMDLLTAYDRYVNSTRLHADAYWVTLQGLRVVQRQSARHAKETINLNLKKVIKHRIDDIRGDITSSVKNSVIEEETADINALAAALQAYSSHDLQSIVGLWKGKPPRVAHGKRASASRFEDMAMSAPPQQASDSENDVGIGCKLLKGVSKRTKKLGDNVSGLLDKTILDKATIRSSTTRDEASKLRQSYLLPAYRNEDDHLAEARRNLGPDSNRSTLAASRLSTASNHSPGSSIRLLSPADGRSLMEAPTMRRAATEIPASALPLLSLLSGVQPSVVLPVIQKRKRRYSINSLRDLPKPEVQHTRRFLKADLQLRLRYWELQLRERELEKLVINLQAIDKSLNDSLGKLGAPVTRRAAVLNNLGIQASNLHDKVQHFVHIPSHLGRYRDVSVGSVGSPPSPGDRPETINALEIIAQRLPHAQLSVDERLRELDGSRLDLMSKVGGSEVLFGGESSVLEPGAIVAGLQRLKGTIADRQGPYKMQQALGYTGILFKSVRDRAKTYL